VESVLGDIGNGNGTMELMLEQVMEMAQSLIKNLLFLTNFFQLHDICDYVSIGFE
jgi:hypothetical protein